MRFEGQVKSWNDERGFGFIEPANGGQEVFVHIKAFSRRGIRPQLMQRVSFEVELNADGKKRAKRVEAVRGTARAPRRHRDSRSAQWGVASIFAIPLFMLVYLAVAWVWRVPGWVAALYLVVSLVCFAAYAVDKFAATANGRRISENTLHLLGLAGGWPGAIVAQQLLRHKSSKVSFRSMFWVTVVMNVTAFVGVNSPFLRPLLSPLLAR